MPKSPMQDFPEIFVSTSETATAVSRAVSQGELRQIGSKLYTRNLVDPPRPEDRRCGKGGRSRGSPYH